MVPMFYFLVHIKIFLSIFNRASDKVPESCYNIMYTHIHVLLGMACVDAVFNATINLDTLLQSQENWKAVEDMFL